MKKLFVVLTVGLLVGVATGGDDAKKELKKFAGTWSVVSAEEKGEKVPEGEVSDVRLEFSAEKLTYKKGDQAKEGTFKIDPSKKPAHIDVSIDGKDMKGIYVFKGKELKMCVSEDERPSEFASKEGTKTILVVLKRETK